MAEFRYRKGDIVEFQRGTRRVRGVVKEDRGPIGVNGRNLYLIDFGTDIYGQGPSEVELPAVDLVLVRDAGSTAGTASR
jgi:hypothetical protein